MKKNFETLNLKIKEDVKDGLIKVYGKFYHNSLSFVGNLNDFKLLFIVVSKEKEHYLYFFREFNTGFIENCHVKTFLERNGFDFIANRRIIFKDFKSDIKDYYNKNDYDFNDDIGIVFWNSSYRDFSIRSFLTSDELDKNISKDIKIIFKDLLYFVFF